MIEKALKVAELKPGEVGLGIVRVDPEIVKILGLNIGDYIQIIGNKKVHCSQNGIHVGFMKCL